MNKAQLIVLWLIGLAVSAIMCYTGIELLNHVSMTRRVWENGYPITLLAGTAWGYIAPIIIIGVILMVTVAGKKKK